MRHFSFSLGILVTSSILQTAQSAANSQGPVDVERASSMNDFSVIAPCVHRIILSGDYSLLLKKEYDKRDWMKERGCQNDATKIINYLNSFAVSARSWDRRSKFMQLLREIQRNIEFTDISGNENKKAGPYSFLFILTLFQLVLERSAEIVSAENPYAAGEVLIEVSRLASGPSEVFRFKDGTHIGIFDWAGEMNLEVPGFITAIITGYAAEQDVASSAIWIRVFLALESLSTTPETKSIAKRFVCMVNKTALNDQNEFSYIRHWLARTFGVEGAAETKLPRSFKSCDQK